MILILRKKKIMAGWWHGKRHAFLTQSVESIANELSGKAVGEGLKIEQAQYTEWIESIKLLQSSLASENMKIIDGLILEYDFKRRGLRMDVILLVGIHTIVIEFKRSKLNASDNEQVVNYCVNLCEFHKVTQLNIKEGAYVIPILVSRENKKQTKTIAQLVNCYTDWPIPKEVTKCYGGNLEKTIESVLSKLDSSKPADYRLWNNSAFNPSSTIIDAALSLYGNHDVSAIKEHSNEMDIIHKCTNEIKEKIHEAREKKGNTLIFMSGSPGAGKTLVGLDLTFSTELKDHTVFLTGNAPLVEVLQASLERSYTSMDKQRIKSLTGYSKQGVKFVQTNTVFKIVKAHHFLKIDKNEEQRLSTDGNILVIDEAQRTYEKGRMVIDHKLEDHEANLIIKEMKSRDKPVIVVLIGHKQNINRGERGAVAWLEAAEKYNWDLHISDETLDLDEFDDEIRKKWKSHDLRHRLEYGHLKSAIRYYRSKSIEKWTGFVLRGQFEEAFRESQEMNKKGHYIYITRSLNESKDWVKEKRIGEERAGLIASGKGVRLASEGLFPDMKPDIAKWMLTPMGDIRSSNMLEKAQNQFQIQGLEIDYSIVCWDADLRIEDDRWKCYNMSGTDWQKQKETPLQERKNGYRVLLTRARKGMVIFVPNGDQSEPIQDTTRHPDYYDSTYNFLIKCGATKL